MKYRTIVADPPWDVKAGPRSLHDPGEKTRALVYPTMDVAGIELFARRQRLGWDTWGDEALEHVELSA